jgi:hypothetical protein
MSRASADIIWRCPRRRDRRGAPNVSSLATASSSGAPPISRELRAGGRSASNDSRIGRSPRDGRSARGSAPRGSTLRGSASRGSTSAAQPMSESWVAATSRSPWPRPRRRAPPRRPRPRGRSPSGPPAVSSGKEAVSEAGESSISPAPNPTGSVSAAIGSSRKADGRRGSSRDGRAAESRRPEGECDSAPAAPRSAIRSGGAADRSGGGSSRGGAGWRGGAGVSDEVLIPSVPINASHAERFAGAFGGSGG